MDIARGEKLLTTRLEPTSTGVGLTLRAVPVAAAVVRDGRTVATVGALIEMPTQGGGATACDGPQHGEVLPGDPPAAAFDEGASRGANPDRPPSSGGRFIYGFCGDLSFSLSESRGLAVALRLPVARDEDRSWSPSDRDVPGVVEWCAGQLRFPASA